MSPAKGEQMIFEVRKAAGRVAFMTKAAADAAAAAAAAAAGDRDALAAASAAAAAKLAAAVARKAALDAHTAGPTPLDADLFGRLGLVVADGPACAHRTYILSRADAFGFLFGAEAAEAVRRQDAAARAGAAAAASAGAAPEAAAAGAS